MGIDNIQTEARILTGIGWDYLVKEGDPLGIIYGYQTDGMYTVDDFNFSLNSSGNPKWTAKEGVVDASSSYLGSAYFRPGAVKLKDQNGDGTINQEDKVALGCAMPTVTGGFNLAMQLYGFDVSAAFNFSVGNKLYNGDRLTLTQRHLKLYYKNMLAECAPGNAWTNIDWETGDLIKDPDQLVEANIHANRPSPYSNAVFLSDEYIEDASFLRFNTLTVGYTFPRTLTQWVHISKLRIYATATNLFCLTKYSGFDPEVNCRRNNPLTPGIDYSAYPKSMSIVGGINVSF